MNHNKRGEAETKDEEGTLISVPEEAKIHIANYYENLYQAREGEASHKEWTDHINKEVKAIEMSIERSPNQDHFSIDELNDCIKSLKRNKSTGPDRIPSEIYIEANANTRKIYLQAMNKVYDREVIPKQWHQGNIIRLYKGKGTKERCSAERGITLASNTGKLFERLINNRIEKEIKTSEAQPGGQCGKATADHITVLNGVINQQKRKRIDKPLHIAFLDVIKAYDKAWLNAIL